MCILITKRNIYILIIIAIGLVAGLTILILPNSKNHTPTTPSYIKSAKLQELELRALKGDPEAQYGLSLYIDDVNRSFELIKRAAESGYPPAVMTYADMIMSRDKQGAIRARRMLEQVAENGYYRAIVALAQCLSEGKCGPASNKDALTWALVFQLATKQKLIDRTKLTDIDKKLLEINIDEMSKLEKRLLGEVAHNEIITSEANARAIVNKMQKLTF